MPAQCSRSLSDATMVEAGRLRGAGSTSGSQRRPRRKQNGGRHENRTASACVVNCHAPAGKCAPMAFAGDRVGTATLDLENRATGRRITTELWFKAADDARIEWFSPRAPLRSIPIARNADPQRSLRKQPLIVISHGNWGTRFSQGWLALELVKSGYVVLSTSHPGTVGDDQNVSGRYRLWDRSRDVSFALDEVLKQPKMGSACRRGPHRIRRTFVRWMDRREPGRRPIRSRTTKNLLREVAEERLLLRRHPEGRYRGAVAKDAAGIVQGSPGSRHSTSWLPDRDRVLPLSSLEIDQRTVHGGYGRTDEVLEPQANSTAVARQIPGAREVIRPVGHFAYVPECRWLIGPDPHAPCRLSHLRRSAGHQSRAGARRGGAGRGCFL